MATHSDIPKPMTAEDRDHWRLTLRTARLLRGIAAGLLQEADGSNVDALTAHWFKADEEVKDAEARLQEDDRLRALHADLIRPPHTMDLEDYR